MKKIPELSRPEYDVLRILWKHQELSVREVHSLVADETGWAYTTTKTVMDRMIKKQLLERQQVHGVFVYHPLITRPHGLARLIHYFADKVLETDYQSVVSMFVTNNTISTKELKELKALLHELNKNKSGKKDNTP